ncbi:MAG: M48 family metalloprotease [Gammaproteobacteria bacterium]|nr:M48 family metalloprotease [Gammaproteobacteria bacterium]MDH3768699.1 M48 family metalloprotease [Gammaproteobacteria bacterium]
MSRHFLTTLLSVIMALPPATWAAASENLPELGDAGGAAISRDEEYQLGRLIMRQLRESGALLDDPASEEYIQSIGRRLASRAHEGQHKFNFFVVDDPGINAFALPGGFIGVHHGLILATETESELAGVLAHEISHVTQKHIARYIESSGQTSLMTTAAILAAVILGSATGAGSDAIQAAMTVAQGTAIQSQINFTRSNEYEADRIGIALLADAGYDPRAMAAFFETMGRYAGLASQRVPEFLRTHPVSSERVAEARDRAALMPIIDAPSSLEWELARARLRVVTVELVEDAVDFFESNIPADRNTWKEADRYGYALALLQAGRPVNAGKEFAWLLERRESVIAYHTGMARSQLAAGDTSMAMVTYEDAIELFPRNVPLTMYYGQALIQTGQAKKAHELLLDLVNNLHYTPSQVRLLALAASAAGDTADAHYYMSEVHVLNGELQLAMGQLDLALASPKLDGVQRARFQARLDEIREHLPRKRRQRRPAQPEEDKHARNGG